MILPSSRLAFFRLVGFVLVSGLAGSLYAQGNPLDSGPLPQSDPLSPEAALASFKLHPDFTIEPVATEPQIMDPVAMAFDESGRLYVVEMRGYSERRQERMGRVSLLEDLDQDGFFEASTVFADGLAWPTAVHCWNGGIVVGATPDILFLKDLDGDNMADHREVVLTGFGSDTDRLNVQQLLNSFRWSLDNRIQGANGGNPGTLHSPQHPNTEPIVIRREDFSIHPVSWSYRKETGGGQHGMCFDDFGRKFACSNSHHLQRVVYEASFHSPERPPALVDIAVDGAAAPVFRISPDEPWRLVRTRWRVQGLVPGPVEGGGRPSGYFTAATGIQIYRGHAWPSSYKGQVFVADCGSNLVHRKILKPVGVEFVGERAEEEKETEFLASTDNWFRPVQIENGPDGNLYLLDMYRETIEHPWSLPPGLKEHVDLNRGNDRGRIYRIRHKSSVRTAAGHGLSGSDDPESWVELLNHPNAWQRETAARLLFEKQDSSVIPKLNALFETADTPQGRIHALYALQGLGALGSGQIKRALIDPEPTVRIHGIKLAVARVDVGRNEHSIGELLQKLLLDPNIEVCFSALICMPKIDPSPEAHSFVQCLINHGYDPWIRNAVLGLLNKNSFETVRGMFSSKEFVSRNWFPDFFHAWLQKALPSLNQDQHLALIRSVASFSNPEMRMRMAARLIKSLHKEPWPDEITDLIGEWNKLSRQWLDAPFTEETLPGKLAALEWVGASFQDDATDLLIRTISAETSSTLQLAAFNHLKNLPGPDATQAVFPRWKSLAIPVRTLVLQHAARSTNGTEALLSACENEEIATVEIPAEIKSYLRQHPDPVTRARAVRILGQTLTGDREAVIKRFLPALDLPGNPEKGRVLFLERCSQCHRLADVGQQVGPDLESAIRNGDSSLLTQILDPNREINAAYIGYEIELKDGSILTGLLVNENESTVTIKQAGGLVETLPRDRIVRLQAGDQSPMPEGLEEGLDPDDMADLLRFLSGAGTMGTGH